ncbi:MAG: hypothetical protein QM689_02005 [Oscillospiraceae bacterium]
MQAFSRINFEFFRNKSFLKDKEAHLPEQALAASAFYHNLTRRGCPVKTAQPRFLIKSTAFLRPSFAVKILHSL